MVPHRRPGRAPLARGLVAVVVGGVLLAGCSEPDPAPPAGAPSPAAPASSAAAPSSAPAATPSSAAPSAPSSSPAPEPRATESGIAPRRPVETASPRPLDQPGTTADLEVSLVSVTTRTIKAKIPGDSSGPGVLVRLELRNGTGKTLDTSLVQVNVTNAAGNPGSAVDGPPTDRVGRSLRAGRSAEGTYAFLLDDATTGQVTVLVSVRSGQPVLQFRGRAG